MIITVFNVGRGSSVLIQFPHTPSSPVHVGIVDCFSGMGMGNPLLEKLDELSHGSGGSLRIEFLVLTHLHADHFLGVSEIISRYGERIMRFFDPGIDPREVMAADYKGKEIFDTQARKDLKSILKFKEQYPTRITALTAPGITIYKDKAKDIKLQSVAPEGSMMTGVEKVLRDYIRKLKKAVARGEPLPRLSNAYDLNRTSSAIEICHDGKRVILGGDVLNRSWKNLVEMNNLKSDAFLLSHHGAANAFPLKQWDKIHKNQMHVVISGRGYHQPSPSVLKHLRDRRAVVWVTNVPEHSHVVNDSHAYVAKVHYKASISATHKQGNIVCSVASLIKVAGQRIV